MESPDLTFIARQLQSLLLDCEHDGVSDVYLATQQGNGEELVIKANRCGLLHLAAHFVALMEQPGNHIHLDEASDLEECWKPLVISHIADPW